VDDAGCGVDHDLPATGPELQAQIGILVVRRLPFEAEATDLEKVRSPHHEACRGTEIDRARRVVVVRPPDRSLADLDHVAGRQRESAHFLDPAIRIEKHGAYRGDARIAFHGRTQRFDPTGLHEGVVVEEDNVVTASFVHADVVALAEEPVFTYLNEREVALSMARTQNGEFVGVGPVVHDDDFAYQLAPCHGECVQAFDRGLRLVVVEDDDRHVLAE